MNDRNKIKAFLLLKGLTYRDLAKKLGLAESTVRNGLNAEKLPSWAKAIIVTLELNSKSNLK